MSSQAETKQVSCGCIETFLVQEIEFLCQHLWNIVKISHYRCVIHFRIFRVVHANNTSASKFVQIFKKLKLSEVTERNISDLDVLFTNLSSHFSSQS